MRVWFDADINSERAREAARASFITGETIDISRSGIAILVPSIRIMEKYLVGQERPVNVEIDLPNGKVRLKVMGKRYEKVGVHISTERFLVGAQILSFEEGHQEVYETFLKLGNRRGKRAAASRSLELGID
jgi:hypothetical protein